MYASDLQTFLAVKQIEKDVETQDTCLQTIVNSDSIDQTKLSYRIDSGLKTITTCIKTFGEVIIESKPCRLTFVRKKAKQAQMMVPDLSPPMSVENIQVKLKQKINIKGSWMRGCSLLPYGRMALSCYTTNSVCFMNTEGVELFQIGKDRIGSATCDAVYIKDNNSVAVSSGWGDNRCITIIDIDRQEVMTTISMDTDIIGMAVRGRTIYYYTGNKGLNMLNLSDQFVSDIISSNTSNVWRQTLLHTFEHRYRDLL
jgi:hypothetical protein